MDFSRVVEHLLAEARARGAFDNLPRRGPLNLDEDALVPEEERLAIHVLRSNDALPEWIEADKALREQIAEARAALARAYQHYRQQLALAQSAHERGYAEMRWARARTQFEAAVAQINRAIFEFNLRAPSTLVQRMPLRLSEEYARLGVGEEER